MQVSKAKKGYKLVDTGFGKFEEIPEDWNFCDLGKICDIVMGQSPKGDTYNNNGSGTPLINGAADMGEKFPKPKTWTTKPSKLSKVDDIIIGIRASLGDINRSDKIYCLGRGVAALRSTEKIDKEFLFHLASTLGEKFKNLSAGSTIKGITKPELNSILVISPRSITEQQKIATILSNIDNTLEKTNQLVEKTEALKKGMMQKLLTKGIGHTKFKKADWFFGKEIEMPEEWDIKHLSDLANVIDSRHYTPKYIDTGYPLILPNNVTKTKLDLSKTKFTTKEDYEKLIADNRKPEKNDIIYTRNASYGVANQVMENIMFSVGQDLVLIKPKKINPYLLSIILNSEIIIQQLNMLVSGSTFKRINLEFIRNFSILTPINLNEQKQIADILSNVDSQITKEKLQKSNLEILKKGLMQKLLTGQIRVKV